MQFIFISELLMLTLGNAYLDGILGLEHLPRSDRQ
jgi:hypothetical protein